MNRNTEEFFQEENMKEMTIEEACEFWETLKTRPGALEKDGEYIKAFIAFMYDRDNEYNCDICPMSDVVKNFGSSWGCGQQQCWVTVHCNY